MKGRREVLRQLSPMECLSYYYHVKYPQRRDVEISAMSGIKVSTLVTASKKLAMKGLLRYVAFPFNFSEPAPYLFLLTVELEGEGDLEFPGMEDVEEGVHIPLCLSDGRSIAALIYVRRYTDLFQFKRRLLETAPLKERAVKIREHCLLRDGLVALNLFDHSGRFARALFSEKGDGKWMNGLKKEEEKLGDNELVVLPDSTPRHLSPEENQVLAALLMDPSMNYIELSRVVGMNRQRVAKIKRSLEERLCYRAYVDPFAGIGEDEILVIHTFEHTRKVDAEEVISFYREKREKIKGHNLIFLHSQDTTLMIDVYPSYREFRAKTVGLKRLMEEGPFSISTHYALVMIPGEGFEVRTPGSGPSRGRSSERPRSRR